MEDEMRNTYRDILARKGRGEQITSADEAFLQTYKNLADSDSLMRTSDASRGLAHTQGAREMRMKLEKFAKNIGPVDGSSREEVRRWLDAVDHAKKWVDASDVYILEMVGALMRGNLASHMLTYKGTVRDAGEVLTWDKVKKEIEKQFLDSDEKQFLRLSLDRMCQQAFEDTRAYAQRFKEAVRKAYTPEDLKIALIQETLIRTYVGGLRDLELRRQIYLEEPDDLAAAIDESYASTRAISLAERSRAHTMQERHEEPMEIGAVGGHMGIDLTSKAKDPNIVKLEKQLEALQATMATMSSSLKSLAPQSNNTGYKGRRRCFKCKEEGHLARDCPQPQQALPNPQPSRANYRTDRTDKTDQTAILNDLKQQIAVLNEHLENSKK